MLLLSFWIIKENKDHPKTFTEIGHLTFPWFCNCEKPRNSVIKIPWKNLFTEKFIRMQIASGFFQRFLFKRGREGILWRSFRRHRWGSTTGSKDQIDFLSRAFFYGWLKIVIKKKDGGWVRGWEWYQSEGSKSGSKKKVHLLPDSFKDSCLGGGKEFFWKCFRRYRWGSKTGSKDQINFLKRLFLLKQKMIL